MSKETVGLAFPVPNPDFQTFQPETVEELKRIMSGMSLRDYIAIKAMQGILSNPAIRENVTNQTAPWDAIDAYKMADAMLKARSE